MTIECIESIFRETSVCEFEVILVDNASTDGSVEAISAAFPGVVIKSNSTNTIFPTANNEAIKLTKGKYILLLNSDTLILDGALDKMVAFMDANNNVGVCGAKMYNAQLQPWRYETWRLGGGTYLFNPLMLKIFGNIGDKSVDWVCGACLMVRRSVIDQIGFMDEYMYGEDMDWCLRAKKAGWDVWHLGRAHIIHYWGITSTTPEKIAWRIYAGRRSKIYYIDKHSGWHGSLLIRLAILVEAFSKLWLFAAQMIFLSRAARAYKVGQCKGYWRLIKDIVRGQILEPMPSRRQ